MKAMAAESIVSELYRAASEKPDEEFLRFEGERYTYSEVKVLVEQFASELVRRGIEEGDRVAVRLPNSQDWPVAWLSILRIGAIAVPTNYAYGVSDLEYVLENSESAAIVTDEASLEVFDEMKSSIGKTIIRVLAADMHKSESLERLPDPEALRGDALANLQYTSGTTGFPKACMLENSYWVNMGQLAAQNLEVVPGDVTMTSQPFSYIDPQWNTALCLIARIPLVIVERFSASRFWQTVRDEGVTFFYVLGTMPTLLFKQPPHEADRAHRVRLVACSGIPRDLHQELENRWGAPWREAYGLTETGIDISVPVEATSSVGSGKIGWPVETKTAKLTGPDGTEVALGEVGELNIKGKPMMRGYWKHPEATAKVLKNGWFSTGDLAVQREDGAYELVGRLKDMVRRGGENISAAELENVANEHPAVLSSAVVAVPDDLWGESVKLFIQTQPGHDWNTELATSIYDHMRSRLARFKAPAYIAFIEEFPLTPSERIAKTRIRNRTDTTGDYIYDLTS